MRIARIVDTTEAEGPGMRAAIWLQGCSHACPGCFATDLWDRQGGTDINAETLCHRVLANADRIEGITLLGGEPLDQADELLPAVIEIKKQGLSVTVFTGYVYEDIEAHGSEPQKEILKYTDLLIDGEYMEELRDFSRPLVGSSNQRFLFLTDRYGEEDIRRMDNSIEIRIDPNGVAAINGMGDFPMLKEILTGRGLVRI